MINFRFDELGRLMYYRVGNCTHHVIEMDNILKSQGGIKVLNLCF